jgi:hypothetical protein
VTHPFSIACVEGWCNVTHQIEAADPPLTFARADGVGAFQLSTALYRSGPFPGASATVLLSMLREFADARDLGEPSDIVTEDGGLRLAAASFRRQQDFVRVWYLSDGSSFAQVTYTCAWGVQAAELPDCEQMVRTLRFGDETHAA